MPDSPVNIRPIPAETIGDAWQWLGPLLAPAIAHDEHNTPDSVRDKLLSGEMEAAMIIAAQGRGVVVSQLGKFDGVYSLWMNYIAGKWTGGPKALVALLRHLMDIYCDTARNAGCAEVRIGGRDYRRVFPDFEPLQGVKNGMKKVL